MRRDEEGAGHRRLRVQSLIREELEALLRDDVSDPDLAAVRLAAVALSVDYRHLKVHFVVQVPAPASDPAGDARARRTAQAALERATAFFRARLAEAIEMKRLPELRFVCDGVVPSPA